MAGTREAGATRPRASSGPAGLPAPRPGRGRGGRARRCRGAVAPSLSRAASLPLCSAPPLLSAVVRLAAMQRAPGTGWRKIRVR